MTQAIHTAAPSQLFEAEVSITGATNLISRFIAGIFRMPRSCTQAPLLTSIEMNTDGTETWSRFFPYRCMQSRMGNPDAANQTIEECFGLFCFRMRLETHKNGLDMFMHSGRLLGISLPEIFLPAIVASERANGDRHLFDVSIALPVIGQLVHYSGWLKVKH